MPPLETPGHSQASLDQSLVGSLLPSHRSWCTQGSVCALQESVSPVLCKFWWLYGGVNGNLLQEGLCHTQVCYTRIPCPCSSPLLTLTSTGEISGVTGKFGLGEQNEAGQRLIQFCQENALVIANTPSSNNTREDSTH